MYLKNGYYILLMIYLVQPCELVDTKRYKIGMSSKKTLDRVNKGYRKGTRYLNIQEVKNPLSVENKLKEIFNKKYKLIAGKEYFEGDEEDMKRTFVDIVNRKQIIHNNRKGKCFYFAITANFFLFGFLLYLGFTLYDCKYVYTSFFNFF